MAVGLHKNSTAGCEEAMKHVRLSPVPLLKSFPIRPSGRTGLDDPSFGKDVGEVGFGGEDFAIESMGAFNVFGAVRAVLVFLRLDSAFVKETMAVGGLSFFAELAFGSSVPDLEGAGEGDAFLLRFFLYGVDGALFMATLRNLDGNGGGLG